MGDSHTADETSQDPEKYMKVLWDDDTEVGQDELTKAQWDSINKLHTRFNLADTIKLSLIIGGEYVMVGDISIRRDGYVGGRVMRARNPFAHT